MKEKVYATKKKSQKFLKKLENPPSTFLIRYQYVKSQKVPNEDILQNFASDPHINRLWKLKKKGKGWEKKKRFVSPFSMKILISPFFSFFLFQIETVRYKDISIWRINPQIFIRRKKKEKKNGGKIPNWNLSIYFKLGIRGKHKPLFHPSLKEKRLKLIG